MNNPMTYIQNGDYLIPDLKLSQQPEKPLGKYGRMRKTYLKEHRPIGPYKEKYPFKETGLRVGHEITSSMSENCT